MKRYACKNCGELLPDRFREYCLTCETVSIKAIKRKDLKWDDGKLKFGLILPGFEKLMAEILTKGEINHPKIDGTPSWQHVEPEAYLDAIKRHINSRQSGEVLDDDMKTNHWGHVAVNAMFLWWFDQQEGEEDG